jgi:Na+/H+ antiporter NhaD/arsenite permease-like protein
MIIIFLIGYVCIALEHPLKINKAASAILLSVILWTAYGFYAQSLCGSNHVELLAQVTNHQIIEHLGDISEVLFFLLGAMTIVELVDVHGGFDLITNHITTKNKRHLLWMIAFFTFFLSAILDNLTTAIVMVMVLRKLLHNKKERWIFASMVIIAANSGGAFSPIGDVTTIMLWIHGNVTAGNLIPTLLLPSIVSMCVPVFISSFFLKGEIEKTTSISEHTPHPAAKEIGHTDKLMVLILGVGALIFVPIFKSITHLPPFIGILLGLSILWIYTERMYHRMKHVDESRKARISLVLTRIDTSTILFFLGILMSVAALQAAGILTQFSTILSQHISDYRIINLIIGFISSIVDNVPLVAGAMGMYGVQLDPSSVLAVDGAFWIFLSYCAGVGGSLLIIGSAAGVAVMGIEKIDFIWYLKKISLLALAGYIAGALVYILQMQFLFSH